MQVRGALRVVRCRVSVKVLNLRAQVNVESIQMADWLL